MSVPSWIYDSIFYQIFPDRFYSGSTENDPPNIVPWDSTPTFKSLHGGDLQGIIEKLDYLEDLGINAIYLNPIFLSTSSHGYNTSDYFQIEPRIGDEEIFKNLIDEAHNRDMKVILDGVFNHTGRGFFAFVDVLENGTDSPYVDWYHINRFPLEAYDSGKAESYKAWFDIKSLPKLNTNNPQVCDHIMRVISYWIKLGADGWRLDVPNEIDDDNFWSRFRNEVKQVNSDAYLVGEIWHPEPRWIQHFDGLMNYPFRDAVIGILNGTMDMEEFVRTLMTITTIYPWENVLAMYVLLGSHDTERIFSLLSSDIDKMKLALTMQFFFPGIPAIYYGDEIGMLGGKDPECRGGFPWQQEKWNKEIRNYLKELILLRKTQPAIQSGCFSIASYNTDTKTCVFERQYQDEKLVLVVNFSDNEQEIEFFADTINADSLFDLRTEEDVFTNSDYYRLSMSAFSSRLLRANLRKE